MTVKVTGACLLSVIVPTFNYAHLLPRLLGSVLPQVIDGCEVIVVDDGSTDNTLEVLAAIQLQSQQSFRFVSQANAGAAAARNYGWRISHGQWLLFLDSDDELLPGAIELLLAACRQQLQADLVLTGHAVVFPDGREKWHSPTPVSGSAYQRAENYLLRRTLSISHGACIYRRSVFQHRPYVETLHQSEDIPVFAYMLVMSRVVCIDQPTVRVHKHAGSLRRSSVAEGAADELVEAVFACLPEECRVLRKPYRAQRDLSVFRRMYQAREWQKARKLYCQAFSRGPRQALRWAYLSKFMRLMLRWNRG